MAWEKPSPSLIEAFDKALPDAKTVERRKMFGCPVGFVNGNMFAGLHENKVALRLPDSTRGKAFEPLPGRVMRGWIVAPQKVAGDARTLRAWIAEAFDHTSTMPPKLKKPAKKKTRKH